MLAYQLGSFVGTLWFYLAVAVLVASPVASVWFGWRVLALLSRIAAAVEDSAVHDRVEFDQPSGTAVRAQPVRVLGHPDDCTCRACTEFYHAQPRSQRVQNSMFGR